VSERAYACPQCGGLVPFQTSITTFAVCAYCRSMVVRTDEGIRRLGEMAQLPPDLSPLQIGTRGEWMNLPFQLVGRIRLEYSEGSWNEWFAVLPDGLTGWLAEAQGFFMFTTRVQATNLPPPPPELPVSVNLSGKPYRVVDVKPVTVVTAEGTLPDIAPPGATRTNADLAGNGGAFGTLEFHDTGTEAYVGRYATFAELMLTGLRPVPGWDGEVKPQEGGQALNCPQCGAVVTLRAAGQTQSAVCGSCGTLIDTANPIWRVLQQAQEKLQQFQPLIPIGARGELEGVTWEVIGLQRRGNSEYSWQEYLLFNPWHGFRFLTTSDGHWNLVERLLDVPQWVGTGGVLGGKKYSKFARGEVKVLAVLGEFYWKVRRGERASFTDYINPPEILSYERYDELQEDAYSLGRYVEPRTIKEAFKLQAIPRRSGVFLNQPNPWARRFRTILPWFVLALISAICIQVGTSGRDDQPLWHGAFEYQRPANLSPAPLERTSPSSSSSSSFPQPPAPEAAAPPPDPNTVTTPHFQISGKNTQPVRVRVQAPVSNSWIGFDIDLVNATTHTVYPGSAEVSYYFGSDSDGAWTEGSQSATAYIPEVPPGEYYLDLDPDADPSLPSISYTVSADAGGLFFSNFFLTLVVICAWPLFIFLRQRAWEATRWAESDFSP
jgi:hypothetical protein